MNLVVEDFNVAAVHGELPSPRKHRTATMIIDQTGYQGSHTQFATMLRDARTTQAPRQQQTTSNLQIRMEA